MLMRPIRQNRTNIMARSANLYLTISHPVFPSKRLIEMMNVPIECVSSWNVGDRAVSREGRDLNHIRKESYAAFCATISKTQTKTELIEMLLDSLKSKRHYIAEINGTGGAVAIALNEVCGATWGWYMHPELLSGIGDLGIILEFDLLLGSQPDD